MAIPNHEMARAMAQTRAEYENYKYKAMARRGLSKYDGLQQRWYKVAEVADRFAEMEKVLDYALIANGSPHEDEALDKLEKQYEQRVVESDKAEQHARVQGFIQKANETFTPTSNELQTAAYTAPLEAVTTLFTAVWGSKWYSLDELIDPLHYAMHKRLSNNGSLEVTEVAVPEGMLIKRAYRVKGT